MVFTSNFLYVATLIYHIKASKPAFEQKYLRKNIEDPLPGFMIKKKYKRSLVRNFLKRL